MTINPARPRCAVLIGVPLALVSVLMTTAAGCGSTASEGGAGSGAGGAKSALQCEFTTYLEAPVSRQIAATS